MTRFGLWAIALLLGSGAHCFLVHRHHPSTHRHRHFSFTTHLFSTLKSSEQQEQASTKKPSRRRRFLNRLGLRRLAKDNRDLKHRAEADRKSDKVPKLSVNITTLEQLEAHWNDERFRTSSGSGDLDYTAVVRAANVQGDTQVIGSPLATDYTHPVVQLLHERKRQRLNAQQLDNGDSTATLEDASAVNATSNPTLNGENATTCTTTDHHKIALAVEGGGMRGCVSAGMICALHYLNLSSCFDVVYGSSAGTIVGAYLITGQLPWFGPEVYYDRLTTAGKDFIDTRRLLRALGLGLLDPRLLKDVLMRRENGKPVLNLPFLLQTTLQDTKPLDWDTFVERQEKQPLKVVASGLKSERAIVMDMASGHFETLEELAECMHASCLLPGIAGPAMNLDTRQLKNQAATSESTNGSKINGSNKKLVLGNNLQGDHYEPLADALLFEPLPYRSALEEGATHVVVIRSRPDGVDVTGSGGFFEQLIFRRFFLRKNKWPNMFRRLQQQLHKKLYAEDVLTLNQHARSDRHYDDTSEPHLLAIAQKPGSPEVSRLETGRQAIFEGLRRGFARAYDALVEDPAERGRGEAVAKEYFPDEILDYHPLDIDHMATESAFEAYMREHNVSPKVWKESS